MASKTRRKPLTPKFENRVRFNWGYHDAAQSVREGWDNAAKNFGFGPALTVTSLADVVARHPDASYAQGFLLGLRDAKVGAYHNDSQSAWMDALAAGLVAE